MELSLTLLGICLTVFALLFDFWKRRRSWSRYPPGPPSLPFVGNLTQVNYKNHSGYYAQLRKRYGDVFSLQFCWTNVVVLNGFTAVKEALIDRSEDTSDRPHFPVMQTHGYPEHCRGVVCANYGPAYKYLKRFTLSTLRNFGVGKKSLEKRMQEEALYLCSEIKSKEGHPFDPHDVVFIVVLKVICSIMFSNRFECGDRDLKLVLTLINKVAKSYTETMTQIVTLVPALIYIPRIAHKVFQYHNGLCDTLREFIDEHKKSRQENVRRDFTDAFLEEVEKATTEPNSCFSEANLVLTVLDMFVAGITTIETTLRWGLLCMILYPDIQERVQEEIDQVIGRQRSPSLDDRANMPYTNAVIHEIQRFGDIIPFSVDHMTSNDTEIHGFFIPKGTTLVTNLSSVLKDESLWEHPHQFYPKHFLDEKGQFIKREAFIPFSTGRRICLGEQLTRMELFLFFTSLLQQFNFFIPRDQPRPTEEPVQGFLRAPQSYQLCAIVR